MRRWRGSCRCNNHVTHPRNHSKGAAGLKILIVEDDPTIASGVLGVIARTEFSADHAETLADAAHALATSTYELIVLGLT